MTLVEGDVSSGADLEMAAMGLDSADLNADGQLDYCITDVGRPLCLVSQGDGLYAEGGASLGVYPDGVGGAGAFLSTVGWSLDFADLDNDGWMDLMTHEIVHWDVGSSSDPSEILHNLGDSEVRFERPGNAAALGCGEQ